MSNPKKQAQRVRKCGDTLYLLTQHEDAAGSWETLDACAIEPDGTYEVDEFGAPAWTAVDVESMPESDVASIMALFGQPVGDPR